MLRCLLCVPVCVWSCVAQEWHPIAPSAFSRVAAFDNLRNDVLVLGHQYPLSVECWRGDGEVWRPAPAPALPPQSIVGAMIHDPVRDRMIALARDTSVTTFEFDGARWQQIPTAQAPSFLGPIAFDLARELVVMVAGTVTWEFDGAQWLPVVTNPSLPSGGPMAYDVHRGTMVMFGGNASSPTAAVLVDETWLYDGMGWRQAQPRTRPPARTRAALAHDPVRGRTVLFGGANDAFDALTDTWEWDGIDWTQRLPAHSPPARDRASMLFDWGRSRCVLHSGLKLPSGGFPTLRNDTWVYDGLDWTRLGDTAPPHRRQTAMAYDLHRHQAVVFGGTVSILAFDAQRTNETWTGRDGRWQLLVDDGARPSPRRDHRMIGDDLSGFVLLFGGSTDSGIVGDTWKFDGATWAPVTTPVAPPARLLPAMAFDAARRRIVMFGGEDDAGCLGDTWEFDGSAWAAIPVANGPAPRKMPAMAYSPTLDRSVMFGGRDDNQVLMRETWEYVAGTWQLVPGTPQPLQRVRHAMAFDPLRGAILLTGGEANSGTPVNDSWRYDGAWTWVEWTDPPGWPLPHLVHDPVGKRMLRFDENTNGAVYRVTERRAPATATFARGGVGCPGSAPTPSLDAAPGSVPALGTTLQLQFASLPQQPGALVLALGFDREEAAPGLPLPAPLDAIGRPDCRLWNSLDLPFFVPHNGGAAAFALAIPNDPLLDGLVVGAQAFVFDPLAPGGSGSVTNGAVLLLR
ncbi:MAG: hypothetical protein AB7O97_18310 [Planctomycetota bacterium]